MTKGVIHIGNPEKSATIILLYCGHGSGNRTPKDAVNKTQKQMEAEMKMQSLDSMDKFFFQPFHISGWPG